MRISSLRQAANIQIKGDRRGKYQDRKHRQFVIQKMINDLYAIKQVPPSWQALDSQHIQSLVAYWKKRKTNPATIMRYMTIIRRFLTMVDCDLENIDNKSLQLSRTYKRKRRIKMTADFWQTIEEPTVRIIMALQTQFGLTFSEAIQLKDGIHIHDDKIIVYRCIAFNSSDRSVPIVTAQQKAIIKELLTLIGDYETLSEAYGYDILRLRWRTELKKHRLPSNKSWRYWYAKQRFEQLLPEIGHYKTCLLIRDEMGIKSRNTLWLYLKEK